MTSSRPLEPGPRRGFGKKGRFLRLSVGQRGTVYQTTVQGGNMPETSSKRQAKQSELVEEGKRLPGVVEALEVYRRAAPGAGQVVAVPRVRHATGGNAS